MRNLRRGKEAGAKEGQANKSTWRMPWYQETTKDVISCDKLRGDANSYRSADFRMGEPGSSNVLSPYGEFIVIRGDTR